MLNKIVNYYIGGVFICLLAIGVFFIPQTTQATVTFDYDLGTYANDTSDVSDFSSQSNANVDTASSTVKLTNASSGFTAPFYTTGYVITTSIIPSRIGSWGTLTYDADLPEGTSVKVYLLGGGTDILIGDGDFTGNSSGFTDNPLDLSDLSFMVVDKDYEGKAGRLRFKFELTTTDTNVTPTVSNINFNWTLINNTPTAADISPSPDWAHYLGNKKLNNKSTNSLSDYYVVNWVGDTHDDRGYSSYTFLYNNKFIYQQSYREAEQSPHFYGIDIDSKEQVISMPNSGDYGIITANGDYYSGESSNDSFYSFNLDSQETNWLYSFGDGHVNYPNIGSDGTIYTARTRSDLTNGIRFVAFNPDSSIKWESSDMDGNSGGMMYSSPILVDDNDNVYFSYRAANTSGTPIGYGKLIALNPTDGSQKWSYDTGDSVLLAMDDNDVLYTINSSSSVDYLELYAINSDGTLNWKKVVERDDGVFYFSPTHLSVDDDLNLVYVNYFVLYDGNLHSPVIAYSTEDGSEVKRILDIDYSYIARETKIDSVGKVLSSFTAFEDTDSNLYSANLEIYNTSLERIFRLVDFNTKDSISYINYIEYPVISGDSEIFSLYENNPNSADNDARYFRPFSLTPWTMTVVTDGSTFDPGLPVTFTVTTTMPETNLLLTGDNKIQVVMDNGDKIALSYVSGSGDNHTWSGTYTLPNSSAGYHTYTVEASAAQIQTDITTTFDSPATNSENTGLTTTGSFTVNTVTGGTGSIGTSNNASDIIDSTSDAEGDTVEDITNDTSTDNNTVNNNQTTSGNQDLLFATEVVLIINQTDNILNNPDSIYLNKLSLIEDDQQATSQSTINIISNFIDQGTNLTQNLGAGERAGVVNSFIEAFNKAPKTTTDWDDIIKISQGRWPTQRNSKKEQQAEITFQTIYLRQPERANPYDDAAIMVMAYGLRPNQRSLTSERRAITIFKNIFNYIPISATDWDTVRAIAYSGAER